MGSWPVWDLFFFFFFARSAMQSTVDPGSHPQGMFRKEAEAEVEEAREEESEEARTWELRVEVVLS